ncbi:MAG: hypothetical protein JO335_04230 [Sphingomonas sp.]|nr:hypothetical protein [Sphingomonas sp.]
MLPLLIATAASAMMLPALQPAMLKPSFKAKMNEGGSAALQVRVVVSPTGNVVDCRKAFLNGPPGNVDAFCSMLRTRLSSPARDPTGQAAYGVVYLWSHWTHGFWTGSGVPSWDPPDLALETNHMPKGFADGSLFQLIVQADAKGTVQTCIASAAVPAQAQEMMCNEAAAGSVMPATNESGNGVASIQEFVVRLTPKSTIDAVMKRLRRK